MQLYKIISYYVIWSGTYLANQGVPALSANYVPLHMDYVSQGITGSQEQWTDCLKNVARFVKVENGHLTVKFDEIGVLQFGHKVPGVLATSGFQNFSLQTLVTFCSGLAEVFQNLLQPPTTLSGGDYEILARVLLGFQSVVIFGVKAITPSIKQVVVYTPFYIEKALEDGRNIGLPVTLEHISDATMETAHKRPKEGNFLFSGGRDGPADVIEYQTCVLTQLFQNEIYKIWDKGNQIKKKRSKLAHSEEAEPQEVKRRRVVVKNC